MIVYIFSLVFQVLVDFFFLLLGKNMNRKKLKHKIVLWHGKLFTVILSFNG